MNNLHVFWMILVMALVTYLLRAAPFLLFGGGRRAPEWVIYLGDRISPAAIAMLVVYCVKDVQWTASAMHGAPELLAGILVVALQLWKRNPLLSIATGTAVYMGFIQNWPH